MVTGEYLPTGNKKKDKNLPGMGGVFNTVNLDVYHYGGNNPIKYLDPNGQEDIIFVRNDKASYKKFESKAMVYEDGTFTKGKMALMKIYAKAKEAVGLHLTENDVKDFFGDPNKTFSDFSTLPDDTKKQGTISSGQMFNYTKRHFWTEEGNEIAAFVVYDPKFGGTDVREAAQDSQYNNGRHPITGGSNVKGIHMHAARWLGTRGNPDTQSNYDSGSRGCLTKYGGYYGSFYPYLANPNRDTGRVIIFR